MKTEFVISIDPGAKGAVAILNSAGVIVQVFDMPSVELVVGGKKKVRVSAEMLAAELRLYVDQGAVAVMESVASSPQMGVSSAFAFGESFGIVKGVLAALAVPLTLVTPATWKKALKLNASKDGSRIKAAQLWPAAASEFKRVKDADRAEAALIGYWGLNFSRNV